MRFPNRTHGRSLALAGALLAAGLAACDQETVTEVLDRPVLKMLISPGEATLPEGELALGNVAISGFDLSVPDAFNRDAATYRKFGDCSSAAGAQSCWFFGSVNAMGSQVDPRSPTLGAESVAFGGGTGNGIYVLGPDYWGGAPLFDWWGEITGLPGSQRVWVGFARYGVQPAGSPVALDQAAMLLRGQIRTPDQLVLAGGQPGGSGSRRADLFNTGGLFGGGSTPPFPAEPNANPYVVGYLETNADGATTMDAVISSLDAAGNQVYYTNTFSYAESPIGPNNLTGYTSKQYNYLVVWGENPLTTANPRVLARIQLGADLNGTTLNVQNNAFAPFPRSITDLAKFRELPGGANAFATPQDLTLTLTGLPPLGGAGNYAVFLYSKERDELVFAKEFPSVGADSTVTVALGPELDIDFGAFNEVVVGIVPPGGTTPDRQSIFLWGEFLTPTLSLTEGPLNLGTFNLNPRKTFLLAGEGDAAFYGDSLLVELQRLPAPPAGFQYAAYMVRFRGPNIEAQQRIGVVALDELGNADIRIAASDVGGFENFNTFVVALEPVAAPGLTPAFIQVSENYVDKFPAFFTPGGQ